MNICVYGSADRMPDNMMAAGALLGDFLARKDYGLIFGGFGDGLLGTVATHASGGKGDIIGVFPKVPRKNHTEFANCTKRRYSADKRERKRLQTAYADAFIVLPSGIGVLDELFEILLLKSYGELNAPIIIANIDSCYDSLKTLIREQGGAHLCSFITSIHELETLLANS